jgi:hypothetical protein
MKNKGPAMPAFLDDVTLSPPPLPQAGEGELVKISYKRGTISNATMLIILIMGLIAGPAVSL